ncbi:hypothetical protein PoB_002278200 [Plakobranchus ocellatus]|uniref:Uncharacterized protein n=1 Tax=Plakobranchus ocellatus TaxID=259542 RepID=A0AAV3ZP32_9GAST|nr:hypothetical protein PoB_002278200 [Plakobranchus ocellatus]
MLVDWFLYLASPHQGDLRLSGPPSGQDAVGGARTRDRRVLADLRVDSFSPTPLLFPRAAGSKPPPLPPPPRVLRLLSSNTLCTPGH